MAVTVFAPERIAALFGPAALNEVWMTLAARIQRQMRGVHPVGRYWDRCFVALVETVPDRAWLRTLGLRLAASLRQPVEVTGRDGEPVRVRVDFGVGVVLLGRRNPEPEDVLDDAQRLAEAARRCAPARPWPTRPREPPCRSRRRNSSAAGPPRRHRTVAGALAPHRPADPRPGSGIHLRFPQVKIMRRYWLVFSQAVTVLLAAYFVVMTMKPEWLSHRP